MTFRKKFIFSIILVSIALICIELLSYALLSVITPQDAKAEKYLFHPLRNHVQQSNASAILTRKDPIALPTDEYGFTKVLPHIENAELEIIITGSSSVRSQEPFTNIEGTIPSRLQKMFQERFGNRVKINSLAVGAYTSFNELMTLYEYTEKHHFSADMIVSVNGLYVANKVAIRLAKDELYDIYDENITNSYNDLVDGKSHIILDGLGKWVANSNLNIVRLITTISKRVRGNQTIIKWPILDEENAIIAEKYMGNTDSNPIYNKMVKRELLNFNLIGEIARANDASFEIVLLPAAYLWQNFPDEKQGRISKVNAHFMLRFYADLIENMQGYPITSYADIFDHLPQPSAPYPDDDNYHYNDLGAEIIAQKLFEQLLPNVEAKLNGE